MVPVVHPCQKWRGTSCPLWKNLMVPVVHLDITGWSQLSTYVKNGMVPVVHGTSCLAPVKAPGRYSPYIYASISNTQNDNAFFFESLHIQCVFILFELVSSFFNFVKQIMCLLSYCRDDLSIPRLFCNS